MINSKQSEMKTIMVTEVKQTFIRNNFISLFTEDNLVHESLQGIVCGEK